MTKIDKDRVQVGEERIRAATILWAAGVRGVELSEHHGFDIDRQGRIVVGKDLSIEGALEYFRRGRPGIPHPGQW